MGVGAAGGSGHRGLWGQPSRGPSAAHVASQLPPPPALGPILRAAEGDRGPAGSGAAGSWCPGERAAWGAVPSLHPSLHPPVPPLPSSVSGNDFHPVSHAPREGALSMVPRVWANGAGSVLVVQGWGASAPGHILGDRRGGPSQPPREGGNPAGRTAARPGGGDGDAAPAPGPVSAAPVHVLGRGCP